MEEEEDQGGAKPTIKRRKIIGKKKHINRMKI